MINGVTMKICVDDYILRTLKEDINDEDVSTNAVMPCACPGTVDLIAKQDGIVAGLDVFTRVFTLLDPATEVEFFCKDGDAVKNGEKLGVVNGDIRVLLSGERVALNMPIQGTAADIIKIAMIKVWKALKEEGLKSRLILQVHDELLIETALEEEARVREILTENMKSAADLAVTLEIDLHTGKDWYEAK